MADKGTGFQNIRKSPAARLWRFLTAPEVNSWEDTLATEEAPQAPLTSAWKGSLDPREYAASQLLAPRQQGVTPPVIAASPIRRSPGGAVDTLKSLSSLTPVGGVYSNTGNPPSWNLHAASGQPNTSAALAQSRPDAEARPYAYQQPAVRNAFTMGAPADDARARVMAAEAVKRFNAAEELYKSNKTPEAEASFKEAQADADRWGKWAAMSPVARKQVLMNGERAANAAQGRENFASLRNEMDTPGAAELLAYAAAVNSGGPAVTRQPDGSATVSGRYGSGFTTGATAPRGTRTALSTVTDNLLLDQAAQARVAPGQAANILLRRRV